MSELFNLDDDSAARRLIYTMAIMLIVAPVVYSGQVLWPIQLTDIRWRYGAANALSSVLMMPFVGLSIMVLVSRATDNKNVARIVGLISAILVIGLLGSLVLFALDALQLKSIVNSAQTEQFQTVTLRVFLSTLLFTVAFSILMITAFKSSRGAASPMRRGSKKANDASGLIVGQEG